MLEDKDTSAVLLLSLAVGICGAAHGAEDRLRIEAKINDQPVVLAFDTGAEYSVLFARTAERLKLKATEPSPGVEPPPGRVAFAISEKCRFTLGDVTRQWRFAIHKLPTHVRPRVDGVFAWANVSGSIIRVAADKRNVHPLPRLPDDLDNWTKWDLVPKSRLLAFKLPNASGPDGTVFIHSAFPLGVSLNADRWKAWRDAHGEEPATLTAMSGPAGGVNVGELFWEDTLAVGPFSISDVPVTKGLPVFDRMVPNYEATLGLFALTRFDIVIDGKNGHLYTRAIQRPESRYAYNRIGAVFVHQDANSNDFVAHVVENSPAYRAGIRNGDILVRVGELDVTKWRTDPKVLPLSRFWSQPAGTQLELSLTRGGELVKATVELTEIFAQRRAHE